MKQATKKITDVLHFPNGNIAVFDEDGEQIAELQRVFHELWAEHAVRCGYDPEGVKFNGARLHKTEESGWIRR